MFKNLLYTGVLLTITNTGISQTSIGVYDDTGFRIGTFSARGDDQKSIEIVTHDGYIIGVNPKYGFISQLEIDNPIGEIYFSELLCQGTKFIKKASTNRSLEWVGGIILPTTISNAFVRVEWGGSISSPIGSRFTFIGNTCETYSNPNPNVEFLNEIKLITAGGNLGDLEFSHYGIGDYVNSNIGITGYKTPIVLSVEKSNTVFCSGFESCASQ